MATRDRIASGREPAKEKNVTKPRAGLLLLAVAALVALPVLSPAEPPPGKGGDNDADAAGELYGDLYVLERDGNGEPIAFPFSYPDPETDDLVQVDCLRPLAGGCALLADCAYVPLNVEKADFDPEIEDACGPQLAYTDCLQEIGFGRGSVARSQPFVIDSAYAEFLKTIGEAVDVRRDPAGRVELLVPPESDPTAEPVWKTIDAPLENLGLYREVMRNGCLGTVTDEVVGEGGVASEVTYALDEGAIDLLCGGSYPACADSALAGLLCAYPLFGSDPDWWMSPTTPDAQGVTRSDLLLAASFAAGATDKSDSLGLDEIVNLNTYLGINDYTWVREKKDRILTLEYFEFTDANGGWFTFDKGQDFLFDGTTAPLLVWDGSSFFEVPDLLVFGPTPPGVDLAEVVLPVCRSEQVLTDALGVVACDSGTDPVYDPAAGQYGCGGANWFAQAAEYARKTIWFLHNWEVPEVDY